MPKAFLIESSQHCIGSNSSTVINPERLSPKALLRMNNPTIETSENHLEVVFLVAQLMLLHRIPCGVAHGEEHEHGKRARSIWAMRAGHIQFRHKLTILAFEPKISVGKKHVGF